jgi:hypothetical protein
MAALGQTDVRVGTYFNHTVHGKNTRPGTQGTKVATPGPALKNKPTQNRPIGQNAHHIRPSKRKLIANNGHHTIQLTTVVKFKRGSFGPKKAE